MAKIPDKKKYMKAYYEANKDKINTQMKAYREANKDKINAQTKAYREANYTAIPSFGSFKGQKHLCYTNGMTKEITKEMVSKIRNNVLKKVIKNPRKFLGE